MPWWLRPTKAGRFYARHRHGIARGFYHSPVLGNSLGYYTYTECMDCRARLYEDTGYPTVPHWS